jgi:hypothetical protein
MAVTSTAERPSDSCAFAGPYPDNLGGLGREVTTFPDGERS